MKTPNRRRSHGADPIRVPEHRPDAGAPGRGPVSVGPQTYEVRCDLVPAHQGTDPAQIPWLEDSSGDQQRNGSYSGVI